jgi:hypothetical protein
VTAAPKEFKTSKAKGRGIVAVAAVAATGAATGAAACGACCVLPFALPAAALATGGGVLAWFGGLLAWATAIAIIAVVAGWAWVGAQIWTKRRRPAKSTLLTMGSATLLLVLALAWPKVEPTIIALLRT